MPRVSTWRRTIAPTASWCGGRRPSTRRERQLGSTRWTAATPPATRSGRLRPCLGRSARWPSRRRRP
jgi:hypothetical protein